MKTERTIQANVLAGCGSLPNVRLFRNSVGVGFVGRPGHLTPITFGLHKGSGDLIGWRQVTITPDMVGRKVAQFVSIEVKRPGGRIHDHQRNWRFQVHDSGGFALITDNPDTARTLLERNEL